MKKQSRVLCFHQFCFLLNLIKRNLRIRSRVFILIHSCRVDFSFLFDFCNYSLQSTGDSTLAYINKCVCFHQLCSLFILPKRIFDSLQSYYLLVYVLYYCRLNFLFFECCGMQDMYMNLRTQCLIELFENDRFDDFV